MDGQSGEAKAIPGTATPKLNEALRKAQTAMKPVEKGALNPGFKSKDDPKKKDGTPYADFEDIVTATQPHLAANGLSIIQEPIDAPKGCVRLRTCLLHDSGEERVGVLRLPCVNDTPQAYGSALSYAKRYSYQAMTGAVAKGEDDDGNAASGKSEATPRRAAAKTSEVAGTKTATSAAPAGGQKSAPRVSQGASGAVFGNFGRSKGKPVAGASVQDLEWYREACLRSINDPSKSRFHAAEQVLLSAIDDELSRHTGGQQLRDDGMGGPPDEPPPHDDSDQPF